MNISLHDTSIKYLHKTLKHLAYGKPINPILINKLANTYILGQGYLIDTSITRVDHTQVRRIEEIIISIIEKIKLLKNKQKPSTTNVPDPSTPASGFPASGFPASGFPASGLPASGLPASGFPASGFPASGFPASGP
jgi:hypothetical protein